MTVISYEKLSSNKQSSARQLIEQAGLVLQAEDRPLYSIDLLFYISEASMPIAAFMRQHGLFMDTDGLHFDLTQFSLIRTWPRKS